MKRILAERRLHPYAGVLVAFAIVAFAVTANRVLDRIVYDDRAPMQFWNLKTSKVLRPGQTFLLEFDYTKREECYPPQGRGEVEYRLWTQEAGLGFVRFKIIANSISFASPAVNGHRQTMVPLPVLDPGRYALQSRAEFWCRHASRILEVWSDLWEFDVTP